jgi:hypothetical protein
LQETRGDAAPVSPGLPERLTAAATERGSGDERRWFAVGSSNDPDARAAGAEAASRALVADDAKLLVVFCAEAYQLDELLAGIEERSGGVPLIGCSTAGEISTGGPEDSSVVVTALGGPGFSVATAAAESVSIRLRGAGAEVATALSEGVGSEPNVAFLLLTDGLCGDQEEIVRGAYSVVGASVPLVGGCAGDNLKMRKTFQLHGGRVLEDAVVGAAISSAGPLGIGVQHGWQRVGEPMLVTASQGTRVYRLDDEPALDLYLNRLDAPEETHTDPAAFTRFALTHPLGLDRRSGLEVRFVGEADFDDRSLGCIAQVPQGGLAWLMEGDADSVMVATDDACDAAMAALSEPPVGLLVFDCIARRGVLGEEGIRREVGQVAGRASGAPVAGFYTYGEIARTRGVNGFHNQTLVVLALG